MKTKVNDPDIRYNGILEKENRFDQLVNWFKKIVDWFWDNKFFISIFTLLIIANIELIINPKIEKWCHAQNTWPLLVMNCFFVLIYGVLIKKQIIRYISMVILIILCLYFNNLYYYPLASSIGLVTGFFIREILKPWFEIFSNGIIKTGP